MKILSYTTKDKQGEETEMIYIKTDNPGRPDFTYFKDQFGSIEELKKEIEKSISSEAKRKAIKDLKISNLTLGLDAEVNP